MAALCIHNYIYYNIYDTYILSDTDTVTVSVTVLLVMFIDMMSIIFLKAISC